jgi:hypothetical protein
MYPDDVLLTAWAIAARHLAKRQKDPTLMIAEGIMQERQKWLIETVNTVIRQIASEAKSATEVRNDGQAIEPR